MRVNDSACVSLTSSWLMSMRLLSSTGRVSAVFVQPITISLSSTFGGATSFSTVAVGTTTTLSSSFCVFLSSDFSFLPASAFLLPLFFAGNEDTGCDFVFLVASVLVEDVFTLVDLVAVGVDPTLDLVVVDVVVLVLVTVDGFVVDGFAVDDFTVDGFVVDGLTVLFGFVGEDFDVATFGALLVALVDLVVVDVDERLLLEEEFVVDRVEGVDFVVGFVVFTAGFTVLVAAPEIGSLTSVLFFKVEDFVTFDGAVFGLVLVVVGLEDVVVAFPTVEGLDDDVLEMPGFDLLTTDFVVVVETMVVFEALFDIFVVVFVILLVDFSFAGVGFLVEIGFFLVVASLVLDGAVVGLVDEERGRVVLLATVFVFVVFGAVGAFPATGLDFNDVVLFLVVPVFTKVVLGFAFGF